MDHSAEDTDIIQPEIVDYEYENLKSGNRSFKISDAAYTCPYCPEERKRDFLYKDLLQHASGVGKCNSTKRNGRDKAYHLALAKYLENDVPYHTSPLNLFEEKRGNQSFKLPGVLYTCPYCPKKGKPGFLFKDLFQHASGVGSCNSKKRTASDKANHLALANYLENDIAGASGPSKPDTDGDPKADTLADHDSDEMFVWPWIGVIMNIPTEFKDGRYVGESGSNLKDQLIDVGFNPKRVHCLWNSQGHAGTALVEFNKDWSGFRNAMSFEKAYKDDHHGKKDWEADNDKRCDLYAWFARADDYRAVSIVGEHLRKAVDIRTVADIMEEEALKSSKLVSKLTNAIEFKKLRLKKMEDRFHETSHSLKQVIAEKDKLHQAYSEEMKKIQSSSHDHFLKIFNNHEKLKLQLETVKKELELRGKELHKREAQNESDRKKMSEELEQNAILNTSLSAAAEGRRKVDEKILKLTEKQKKQMEELHKRIIKLQKQLDGKQAVEQEIYRLRGTLNVMKHVEDEGDQDVLKSVDTLLKNLREKDVEYADLEALNQTLIVKERKGNDELQEARKELVNGLKELPRNGPVGVKRMGELNSRPFHEAMKRKYTELEAEEKASELCSLWEEYLRDPEWHPIKVVAMNGEHQAVIDDEDEKLKELKRSYGDEVYRAVTTALTEINECNPSGRFVVSDLWNYAVGEKATLEEGVTVLLNLWKKKRGPD